MTLNRHVLYHHQKTYCDPVFDPWTAFTWNTNLFSDPSRFLTWCKEQGLHVTLNNHPDKGVQCVEDTYYEMAVAMDVDPTTNVSVK